MPLSLDSSTGDSPRSLKSHARRTERKLAVSRVRHAGVELTKLDREERDAGRCWRDCQALEPGERADAMAKLAKVIDGLRERRRILLGEPLPGSRRAGTERKPVLPMMLVDAEPTPQLSAPALEPDISQVEPTPAQEG